MADLVNSTLGAPLVGGAGETNALLLQSAGAALAATLLLVFSSVALAS